MLPKSYVIFKWSVFALATLLLFFLQYLVLNQISLQSVTPFIYPMLPAVLASYEGLRRGSVFGLVLGLICDLLLPAPFYGFFTITFTLIALFAGLIGENLLSPGFLCSLSVSGMAMLLTGALRIVIALLSGDADVSLLLQLLGGETLLSLPALVVISPLYRVIHRRCAVDY